MKIMVTQLFLELLIQKRTIKSDTPEFPSSSGNALSQLLLQWTPTKKMQNQNRFFFNKSIYLYITDQHCRSVVDGGAHLVVQLQCQFGVEVGHT
jgi:hypothetical protein